MYMDHKESDMTEQLRTHMAVTYNKGMYPLLHVSLVTCIPCYMYPFVTCIPCHMYPLLSVSLVTCTCYKITNAITKNQ